MTTFRGKKSRNTRGSKTHKSPSVADMILGVLRRISTRQALTIAIALMGIGFVVYDHYRNLPNLQIIPRIVYTSNRFVELPGPRENVYMPILNTSFRFINRSRQPATIVGFSSRISLRAVPGYRQAGECVVGVNEPTEFTVKPGESTIRCFNYCITPPLIFDEAKQYEHFIRDKAQTDGRPNGLSEIITHLSTIFYTDTGKEYSAISYCERPAILFREDRLDSPSGFCQVIYMYGDKKSPRYGPEKLSENSSIPTVFLPDTPRLVESKQTTNEWGKVVNDDIWPARPSQYSMPAKRLMIGLNDDTVDLSPP